MKSPITGKEMKIIREERKLVFRKEEFTYMHQAFQDEETKELFTTTHLDELNMLQIYNQYRERHKIPFPKEICEIREKYGVSAKKMAEILGFGVNSYRNYENGEVPSVSNARLIQSIKASEEFLKMVKLCPDLVEDYKVKLIKSTKRLIEKEREDRSEDQLIAYFLGDDLADRFTGYRLPDLKKFMAMVSFFAQQIQPFKTKMNKLLFYADFLNYKKTCYSISGIRYQALQMGPVPRKYQSIYEYMVDKELLGVESVRFPKGYTGIQFVINKEQSFNKDLFNEEELDVMEKVVEVFRDNNASEISDISHREQAWVQNEGGRGLIDYNLAFELTEL